MEGIKPCFHCKQKKGIRVTLKGGMKSIVCKGCGYEILATPEILSYEAWNTHEAHKEPEEANWEITPQLGPHVEI